MTQGPQPTAGSSEGQSSVAADQENADDVHQGGRRPLLSRVPGVSRLSGRSPRPAWLFSDGAVAVLTWLVLTPLGVLLVHTADLDPFSVGGVVMPVGVGCVAVALLLVPILRKVSARLLGLAIGVYAAWVALAMAAALHGTPYGFGLMSGDAGRLTAMATKYMYASGSVDGFVKGLPTEYPPLYPLVVGHVARLVGRPAWELFGETQILVMSATFVVGYIFWRRLVSAPIAFTIVALAPAVFSQPSKDYEFIALVIFAPWVLATFTLPPTDRRGLHWLAGGVIGGMMIVLYQAWLLYTGVGLLVLMGLRLHSTPERRRYLLHLLGVGVTAFVVASWYLVPFVTTLVRDGGERVSDLWMSSSIVDRPLDSPLAATGLLAAFEVVGLLGTVWYRRSTWWAQPLLVLSLAAYGYRAVFLLKTAQDNHTGYLQYTSTLVAMLLVTAAVLTVAEAAPGVRSRFATLRVTTSRERTTAVTAVTILVLWAAMQGWPNWVAGPRGLRDSVTPVGGINRGTNAHGERLPSGKLTRFAPPPAYRTTPFQTDAIARVVTSELGPDARPVTLSYDQRLFSFKPYYGYTSVDRLSANTLIRWDARAAELRRVAAITDPQQFAAASADTEFGPIDVFVLRDDGHRWRWKDIYFTPSAFDPAQWRIEKLAATKAVVAVRRR